LIDFSCFLSCSVFLDLLQQLDISFNVSEACRDYAVNNIFKVGDKIFSILHVCGGRPSDSLKSLLVFCCAYNEIGIDGFSQTLAFFSYLFKLRQGFFFKSKEKAKIPFILYSGNSAFGRYTGC